MDNLFTIVKGLSPFWKPSDFPTVSKDQIKPKVAYQKRFVVNDDNYGTNWTQRYLKR